MCDCRPSEASSVANAPDSCPSYAFEAANASDGRPSEAFEAAKVSDSNGNGVSVPAGSPLRNQRTWLSLNEQRLPSESSESEYGRELQAPVSPHAIQGHTPSIGSPPAAACCWPSRRPRPNSAPDAMRSFQSKTAAAATEVLNVEVVVEACEALFISHTTTC